MKLHQMHLMTAGAVVLVLVSVGTTAFFLTHPFQPTYQTQRVTRQDIHETVNVTGAITSAKNVDLSFDRGGRIASVSATVGQSVQAGQALVTLENAAERSQVTQAQAALDARIAGIGASDLAVYQAAVDTALADLNKTKADAVATSTFAYQNASTVLRSVSARLDDAMSVSDGILGLDNMLANDDIEKYLSIADLSKLGAAQTAYATAKASRDTARASLTIISVSTDPARIESAFTPSLNALTDASNLLDRVSDVLLATPTVGTLTQASLDAKKTVVSSTRTSVNNQMSALVTAQQSMTNAKNGMTDANGSSQGLIAIKQAVYDQAVAALNAKKSPPREVDLAPLRAMVEAAQAAWQKTILRAPADGVVARQDAKMGAIATPGFAFVSVVNPNALQVEGLLSELDASRVHVGDQAVLTTDAYGTSVTFPAVVVSVDQSLSSVPTGSGYKVVVQLVGSDERVKVGMNAVVTIETQSKQAVLTIPAASMTKKNGATFVHVLGKDRALHETQITTGIVAQDGLTEVVSGVSEQDEVVTFGN